MPYAKLDDTLLDRLEDSGVSRDASLLYVEGLSYCSRVLSDGILPARLAKLSSSPDPEAAGEELVSAGWWQPGEGGYVVVDYLMHQDSATVVLSRREQAAERQRRSRLHKGGDHSMCVRGRYCPDGQQEPVTRDMTRESQRESQAPLLSSPLLKEKEKREGEGAASGLPGADAPASQATLERHVHAGGEPCLICARSASNQIHQKPAEKLRDAATAIAQTLGLPCGTDTNAFRGCDTITAVGDGWTVVVVAEIKGRRPHGKPPHKATRIVGVRLEVPTQESSEVLNEEVDGDRFAEAVAPVTQRRLGFPDAYSRYDGQHELMFERWNDKTDEAYDIGNRFQDILEAVPELVTALTSEETR